MSENNMPLISVVTVVFNGAQCLEETIKSVIGQTYPSIEYLVIDGGSSDGTADIIRKYAPRLGFWISEPDNGIYDAMNKGIKHARGEWIIFMNAGDSFYDDNTVREVFREYPKDADMIYGHHQTKYGNGYLRIRKAGKLKSIWKGLPFSHQSLFARTSLMKKFQFDEKNGLAADFEVVYKAYTKGYKLIGVDKVIATTSAQGVSDLKRMQAIKNLWKVSVNVSGAFWINVYFMYLMIDCLLRGILKSMLPGKMVEYLARYK